MLNSESFMYQFVLLPLVCFGGFSVMLAFVLLLPGVGQALTILHLAFTTDYLWQKRKGSSSRLDGT